MKIIVVGCGRVGAELAPQLEQAGHNVTVLDKFAEAFHRLPATFSGRRIAGSGFDRDDLASAGIADADAVAAVTSGDNTNILTARIAREVYEIPRVVARIYDPRRAIIYERLGIPTVATVTWTTDQILRRLEPGRANVEWAAATGDVVLIERALPESWAGRALSDLTVGEAFALTAVRCGASTRLATPGLVGQAGDIVYLTVHRDSVDAMQALLDQTPVRGGQH